MSKENKSGFDVSSFVKGNENDKNLKLPLIAEVVGEMPTANSIENSMLDSITTKQKLNSTRKKSDKQSDTIPIAQNSMDYLQHNIPYEQGYMQSDSMLDETIAQLNSLSLETASDMQVVRNSKTLKNKYYLLTGLMANAVGILNTKLSAIKEKNKVRNDINNLEIKRIKDLKIDTEAKDDNTRIAELYSAFINTPVGMMSNTSNMGLSSMLGAPSQQSIMMPGVTAMNRMNVYDPNTSSNDMWQNSLDPAQKRMLLQAKGSIDIVVMYDDATGSRRYAAIDKATHNELFDVELPDQSTIYDLDINVRGGYAKDPNRNIVYPLILVNNSSPMIF